MLRRYLARLACLLHGLSTTQAFVMADTNAQMLSKKRTRNADMRSFFTTKRASSHKDTFAEELGENLNSKPVYLTKTSWYILAQRWMPSSPSAFQEEWDLHPQDRHALKIYGRVVYEKRWSEAWGVSYSYSGGTKVARNVHESTMVPLLLEKANDLTRTIQQENAYNGCLQNWYQPDDTIGLHADDEKVMRQEFPIFSLSWGGPRRFLFRPRDKTKAKVELLLSDGDLLVMGGTCQKTHQHEVPKLRVTMDPPTSNRINWTIRAFRNNEQQRKKQAVQIKS